MGTAEDQPKTTLPPPMPQGQPYERWVVLVVACIGGLLASIQSSALIIAFPTLMKELDADITTIIWVLLAYLLVVAAIVPVTGRLGDIFGQQFLFNCGFGFFTIASLLSGFAQTSAQGNDLIAYRCIQGIGGTFLFSNSVAIITNVFAPYGQVGIAQGLFQMAFAAGSVLGPVIGGAFAVTDFRWIFWFNCPPSAICTLLGFYYVRNPPNPKKKPFIQLVKEFDYIGAFLLVASLTLMILALTQAVVQNSALSSTAGLTCLIVFGVLSLVAFCAWEHWGARSPIIHMSIFKNRVFVTSLITAVLTAFARGNTTYAMIFFLQGPYGEDPLTAGIQLIPLGLGIILTGFVSGLLADKFGPVVLIVLGPLISALGVIGLALCKVGENYWLLAFALLVVGLGNGIFNSPNGVTGLLAVQPNERGIASGLRLCISFLSQMLGIVITFALIVNSVSQEQLIQLFIYGGGFGSGVSQSALDSYMNAVHIIFWITFASFVLAAIISFTVPKDYKPSKRSAPQQAGAQAQEQNKAQQTGNEGSKGKDAKDEISLNEKERSEHKPVNDERSKDKDENSGSEESGSSSSEDSDNSETEENEKVGEV